jgi:hypothetical protein
LPDYGFEEDFRTDVYVEQRRLEQLVHEAYGFPLLNCRNLIGERDPRRDQSLESAYDLLDVFGVG